MRKRFVYTVAFLFLLFTVLPVFTPQKAAAASKFADGEYSIPFTVLQDKGSEKSVTADYVVSPAKLIVQNGKTHVVMTLNNSSWWQYFKVDSGSGLTDVQTLSTDTANDKRVVKFEVEDIEKLVPAKIHVIVTGIPGFNYDNKYDIRFEFTSSGIPLASVVEKPATTPTAKPVKPGNKAVTPAAKSSGNKAVAPASKSSGNKPDEKKKESVEKSGKETGESAEAEDAKELEEPDELIEASDEEVIEIAADMENDTEVMGLEEELEKSEEIVEQVAGEIVTEQKSKIGKTMFILLLSTLVLGGLYLLFTKTKTSEG